MSESAVAQRYARAIFELGIEQQQLESITQQITDFSDALSGSRELRVLAKNPLIPFEQRDAALVAVAERLGVRGLALNSIRLLAQRHRLTVLPEIARSLLRLADESSGIVRATVTSAKPLGAQYLAELEKALTAITKRRVVIDHKEDPTLLAGVVTQIGDNTIDGSIKGRLADVERQLLHA